MQQSESDMEQLTGSKLGKEYVKAIYFHPAYLTSMQSASHRNKLSANKNNKVAVWITTNCGKFLKKWEYQTTLSDSWEICMQVKKQQLELDVEQQTGPK